LTHEAPMPAGSALRERAEGVRYRAEEDAAWTENERRDRIARDAENERRIARYEAERAAAFVADFLEEPFTADQLTRIKVQGWKDAWAFDLPEFGPMHVRLNSFFGLRVMDGSRSGDGRLVRTLADLIEPTSYESRAADRRDSKRHVGPTAFADDLPNDDPKAKPSRRRWWHLRSRR
jgi:hypothetical protein